MNAKKDGKKWGDYYDRLRKEYTTAQKPFHFQLDLVSAKPKPSAGKFIIVIKKFINMYKEGIKQLYENEEDHRDNYWSQLNRHFHDHYEMGFVNDTYWEQPKNKIKKYFAVLIHTKKIFNVIEFMIENASYLYKEPEEKKKQFEKEVEALDFLKEGQYKIMGEIITKYEEYADNRAIKEKIAEKERLKQEERLREIQKQIKIQEQIEKKKRQERQRIQRQEEEKRKAALKKLEESKKQVNYQNQDRVITSDYFPQQYKAFTSEEAIINRYAEQDRLEIPMRKHNDKRQKNSEKLYKERYKDEFEVFSFSLKPEFSEDKSVCAACKKDLKAGLYIIGGNQNFCHYTGKWFCNEDISQERMPIPWKALQQFDLRGYTVCKKAQAEIKSYFDKPIIQIKTESAVVKRSKRLYDFLVIKRQIHLIYDSICNLDLIEPLLKEKLNYCLKNNLFSLKNLYDIYNGQETHRMQREYQILSRHFYRCEICQKKKGYNCPVCKDPVKIFPFELKDTIGCKICRKLYHRRCLPKGHCLCKDE